MRKLQSPKDEPKRRRGYRVRVTHLREYGRAHITKGTLSAQSARKLA